MDGVGKAVVGVWRAHTVLEESDGAESSPEAPDRFRKLRSSSSLNSLRMSLRKRLPLRSVQASSLPENPTWETLEEQPKTSAICKFSRSARSSIGGVYQRLQRSKAAVREPCLIATPNRISEGDEDAASSSRTPQQSVAAVPAATPRRATRSAATPRHTPGSRRKHAARATPEADVRRVKTGGGRRQLVRMAALRSPFASPNTQSQRQTFDRDLENVSSGLRRLKHLSRAFDSLIGRDESTSAVSRAGGVMRRRLDPSGKLSRSNLTRRATNLSDTLSSLAQTAVSNIRKPN